MNFVNDIIKGVFIGIANIIPGVSGGTMAVSMGIYDKIIYSLTHLFKETKKCIQLLVPIFLGAGIGIVGLAFMIEYLFERFPLQTNLFFIGLILGGLPVILKRIKIKRVHLSHATIFLLFFALIIGLQLFNGSSNEVNLQLSIIEMIKLFMIGVIASATMVIPGVSGSMILMLLGYYQPILTTINTFIKSALTFDIAALITPTLILLPFGLGVVLGIFAIAKLIEMLLARYEALTFCAILGLVVASPIAILMGVSLQTLTVSMIMTSVLALLVGIVIAFYLGKE
jgi:Predicted membrane protein